MADRADELAGGVELGRNLSGFRKSGHVRRAWPAGDHQREVFRDIHFVEADVGSDICRGEI
jgi:hypothetical protein